MELYQLGYFRTLCRYRHFANAAASLYIMPSTLTVAIKKLESEIGYQLVDREGEGFVLTPVGEELLTVSDRIFSETERFDRWLRDYSIHKVVVNLGVEVAAFSSGFVEAVGKFSLEYPGAEVWMKRHSSANMESNLVAGDLDVALMMMPEKESGRLIYRKIKSIEYGLFCPTGHALAEHDKIYPAWMADPEYKIINFVDDIAIPLKHYFEACDVELTRPPVTNKNSENIKRLVENGLGMAVMPIDTEVNEEKIAVRPFEPPLLLAYTLAVDKDRKLPEEGEELITFLLSMLGEKDNGERI